jgi:iron-sulfur cluster assembly protein
MIGAEMDYNDGEFEAGFTFRNPNETGRRGCGKSFKV